MSGCTSGWDETLVPFPLAIKEQTPRNWHFPKNFTLGRGEGRGPDTGQMGNASPRKIRYDENNLSEHFVRVQAT